MWESSVYKLNQLAGKDDDGNHLYRQIVIDVTRSAPSFAMPGKALTGALEYSLSAAEVGPDDTILDFGAGKLRNTLYLLKRGFRVCAVEFAHQFTQSVPARENLEFAKAKFTDRFSTLVYPENFIGSKQRHKLILLINVINIMPVPFERHLVLKLCNERLAEDGCLLWYTQRGDAKYRKRLQDQYKIGDGYYVGRTAKYKTFYREYTVQEIDDLLAKAGFHYDCKVEATWRNQSRLYRKVGPVPLSKVINLEAMDRGQVSDEKIPDPENVEPTQVSRRSKRTKGDPNPDKLKPPALLRKALEETKLGHDQASEYEDLIRGLLEHLFSDDIRDLSFIAADTKLNTFRDILANNKGKKGFFEALKSQYKFKCNRIRVKCRNVRHTLNDNAFDGLGDGLNRHMNFGLLAYRGGIRKSMIQRCRRIFIVTEKVILPLDDNDFFKLLRLKAASQSNDSGEINAFLNDRLAEVIRPGKVFISYSHKDKKYLEELLEFLQPMVRKGIVSLWVDTKLKAGEQWKEFIRDSVNTAEVAILLVSPSFQASDFIVDHELEPLLSPKANRKLTIIPVLVRRTPFLPELEELQFINHNYPLFGKRQDKKDDIWIKVFNAVRDAI
jgi:hypothetical protein